MSGPFADEPGSGHPFLAGKRGGEGGIRTPETLTGLTVFKTAGLNRSPTSPHSIISARMAWRSRADFLFGVQDTRRTVSAWPKQCTALPPAMD